ncbi:putative cysteine-rich receptor-like protein kinase 39 [Porphyridium purpureum]|uniref:Putative cysteine-rich receptor-like protein kinase 39 n=1 Tax=Porphyridium purpureum TaxID=35688 RepID=A0A5J4Z7R5_PORPP|nr:putative cysteine-rich receptor-like protein kinase 39 [Porphyridium purpureum]|eukprot:POR3105..scf295_1
MSTGKRVALEEGLKVAGAVVDDVGAVLPYVAVAYAVTKIIIEYAEAAKANKASCKLLARRASCIRSILLDYFGPDGEKLVSKTDDLRHSSLLDCLSELESELQAACSLVKKFSSCESTFERVLRALRAKNYRGEFQTCGNRLIEFESRLSNIITFKIGHDQNKNHQEMMRALEEDRVGDRSMLERELRTRPEKNAVLQMLSEPVDISKPHLNAGNLQDGDSTKPQHAEPWFIDVAHIEKEEHSNGKKGKFVELGAGGFGTVYRGTCMGETVAIKQVNSSSDTAIREFKNELGMMWRASHENIIRTHGGFYPLEGVDDHVGEVPLILLEYAPKGSLEKYMFADKKETLLPNDILLCIFRGILDGLKYLHASNVVHRDIKPQNILLMDDFTPKISDFGLATVKNTYSFANTTLGTRGYMAPEVIRGDRYNRSCDVWSYGVMLFEMMLGERMLESGCMDVKILTILEDPKRGVPWDKLNKSEYAKQWPDWVVSMAKACLQTKPEKRPTASDIWLQLYDCMGKEGATVAAKSQNFQYATSSSSTSTAKVDALAAKFSYVTLSSGGSAASSSSAAGSAAGPSGSRPQYAQALSAQEKLRLAEECEKAGNMANAYTYVKLAAEEGIAEGRFRLGKILLEGSHGMRQHLEHGAGWVRAAAESGHTDAMIEYGRCYHSGRGVPQNCSLAKEWYAKAAMLGNSAGSAWLKALEAEEQTLLIRQQLDEKKKKVQREREAEAHAAAVRQAAALEQAHLEREARELVAEREAEAAAARRREQEAAQCAAAAAAAAAEQTRRDVMEWQRRGQTEELNKNFTEALLWYRKAAQAGDAYSQCKLGSFFSNGLGGLRENKCAALVWFRKAAEQGYAPAQCNLGFCYANGWGDLREDKRAAVGWYRRAAEQGNASAQYNLGRCYENGWGGLRVDKRAMIEWYSKAAEQGQAQAMDRLKKLGH